MWLKMSFVIKSDATRLTYTHRRTSHNSGCWKVNQASVCGIWLKSVKNGIKRKVMNGVWFRISDVDFVQIWLLIYLLAKAKLAARRVRMGVCGCVWLSRLVRSGSQLSDEIDLKSNGQTVSKIAVLHFLFLLLLLGEPYTKTHTGVDGVRISNQDTHPRRTKLRGEISVTTQTIRCCPSPTAAVYSSWRESPLEIKELDHWSYENKFGDEFLGRVNY